MTYNLRHPLGLCHPVSPSNNHFAVVSCFFSQRGKTSHVKHENARCQTPCTRRICVVVCCSAMHCVAVCCSEVHIGLAPPPPRMCVAVHCSALQCVAVCCSVLQQSPRRRPCPLSISPNGKSCHPCCTREVHLRCRCVLQCVAVCCSVLQCVAVCCSVLQCAHHYRFGALQILMSFVQHFSGSHGPPPLRRRCPPFFKKL